MLKKRSAKILVSTAAILVAAQTAAVENYYVPEAHAHLASEPCDVPTNHPSGKIVTLGPPVTETYQTLLLNVVVNEYNTQEVVPVLRNKCGNLFIREEDLRRWRVKTEHFYAAAIGGEYYLSVKDFPGLAYGLNEKTQTLYLDFVPAIFRAVKVDFDSGVRSPVDERTFGAYLNYGLGLTGSELTDDFSSVVSLRTGLFGKFGNVKSEWVVINPDDSRNRTLVRGNTTFIHDFVDEMSQFRAGDIISNGRGTGSGYRMAGIQIARNFTVEPQFTLTPTTNMYAMTNRPSTATLAVTALEQDPSDTLGYTTYTYPGRLPYGPIELLNVPVSANGRYQFILEDTNGEVQIISQEYFFSSGALKQGIFDYDAQLGVIRDQFDDYDDFSASGSIRYGLTNWFTGQSYLEYTAGNYLVNVGGDFVVPYAGALSAAVTVSDYERDNFNLHGTNASLTLENRYQNVGYVARYQVISRGFRTPLTNPSSVPTASNGSVSLSTQVAGMFSLRSFYAMSEPRDAERREAVGLGITPRLKGGGSFSLSISKELRPDNDVRYALQFSAPFDRIRKALDLDPPRRRNATSNRPFQATNSRFSLGVSKSESDDMTGFASVGTGGNTDETGGGRYNIVAGTGLSDDSPQNIGISYTGRYINAQLNTRYIDGNFSHTGSIGGAMVWMAEADKLFLTQSAGGSYALVRLGPDLAGVRVNNRYADDDGDVLLSNLAAYANNRITINPNDLPFGANISGTQLGARPGLEAGTIIEYSVPVYRDLLVTITIDEPERPLPIGSTVRVRGAEEEFAVGDDGLVYLPNVEDGSIVDIEWRRQQCSFTVALPELLDDNDIPEIGPYNCREIRR